MRLATAAMGTRFELVIADDRPERFRGAAEAALDAVHQCHQRFSRFLPDSLVAHLERVAPGTPVTVDRDTFALLDDAVQVWGGSAGAFDVTAGARAMDAIRLDAARRTVSLDRPGVRLDLGGIAKGHALDLGAVLLREAGVTAAFFHGGGSSAVGIGPAGWRVALGPGTDIVVLRDSALAVSRTGHDTPHPTCDPRTGRPVRAVRRVAMLGPGAGRCDAWATAAAVLGRRPPGLPPDYAIRWSTAHTRQRPCPAAAAS